MMRLHAEGLHRGEAGFPVLKAPENLLIKMQLEFCIHLVKCLFQHDRAPLSGDSIRIQYTNFPRKKATAAVTATAKVSSAVQAVSPLTVARQVPMPTGPRRLVRVHSSSSTSPGDHLAA